MYIFHLIWTCYECVLKQGAYFAWQKSQGTLPNKNILKNIVHINAVWMAMEGHLIVLSSYYVAGIDRWTKPWICLSHRKWNWMTSHTTLMCHGKVVRNHSLFTFILNVHSKLPKHIQYSIVSSLYCSSNYNFFLNNNQTASWHMIKHCFTLLFEIIHINI